MTGYDSQWQNIDDLQCAKSNIVIKVSSGIEAADEGGHQI